MFVAVILLILASGITTGYVREYIMPESIYTTIDFFSSEIVQIVLIAFIFLIGLDMGLMESRMEKIKRSWKLGGLVAVGTVTGSLIAGLVIHLILKVPLSIALSVCAGMGWYSLTGPFLSKTLGAFAGALGFGANFLREVLTFISYPKFRDKTSAISIGGATTMDTTLPLIAKFSDSERALIAFIHGFFITIIVPVLLSILVEVL
ncbi:hypothetical protein Asulf_01647 [Archaeoglobus sulfaticallidus PM70-1]|uniref:Lysine exporter LysO family protein n=1 Tax=Archaeoglobus sulfaticallidus PM70-1 TaxID=387631 RepID=N0BM13_9EURY|nr:lysine exporter LysO family protein [Archaeoglobus sulfaticallidus]AGK61621.1 hypothetical protein Asulf_01647 [Archaeoglobus sulfaticallidus PM70-1]